MEEGVNECSPGWAGRPAIPLNYNNQLTILTTKSRSLPNFKQLGGRTRLRGHGTSGLNTRGPADCQVCCTKVSRIGPRVRVWLRESIVLRCTSSDVLSDNRIIVTEEN